MGDGDESAEQRAIDHDRRTVWTVWSIMCIGAWVALAPATLGYGNASTWVELSGGRGPWFGDALHTALRSQLMTWSDVVAGLALVAVGWVALRPARPVPRWILCLIGIWLVVAPVVLWAPTASGYASDSLAGILVIALAILVPGMPNMPKYMVMGGSTPPGWSYNPSSWAQRSVLIALGFAGFVVSRYLGAYQLGYVTHLWDPFFGFAHGTQPVLDSELSHRWPISDAALGGVAYTFEFLMGWMGGPARWRTMPWMVTIFGILVVPLGLAHVALVMSQPVVVHQWCTFCMVAAACMLPMIPLEIDEVVAMLQHVRDGRRRGDRGGSTWKVFWLGGSAEGAGNDTRSPSLTAEEVSPVGVAKASLWGLSVPWNLVAAAALGVWLLALPGVYDVSVRSSAADVAHLGGAFVLTVAVVSMGEVVRRLRWCNVVAGVAIAVLAVPAAGMGSWPTAVLAVSGLLAAVASVPRGPIVERYADWRC
jgi:hypothetical protein